MLPSAKTGGFKLRRFFTWDLLSELRQTASAL